MTNWIKTFAETKMIKEYRDAVNALLIVSALSSITLWLVAVGVFSAVAAAMVYSLVNFLVIILVLYTDRKKSIVEVKLNG